MTRKPLPFAESLGVHIANTTQGKTRRNLRLLLEGALFGTVWMLIFVIAVACGWLG